MSDLLIHVSRQAMACEFEVRFPADRYPQGTESALAALDRIDALEEQLSYFRPTSQISRINVLAADGPVEVEPPLFALFELAATLHRETEGAYDITSAPLWEAWGFARRKGEIPSDAELAEARSQIGGQWIELDPQQRTVRFLRPGMRINLGSIGKGYALDVAADHLRVAGMADFLFHGGQSSVLARGLQVTPTGSDRSASRAWEIGIRHPGQPGRRIGVVRLRDRALGTSGGQFQSFRHRGRRYGHILDPRTGWPAEGVLSATVVAPSAAVADALSTAFYVMGPQLALDYCKRHTDVGAVLVCPGPHSGTVEIHTAGLSDDMLVLYDSQSS